MTARRWRHRWRMLAALALGLSGGIAMAGAGPVRWQGHGGEVQWHLDLGALSALGLAPLGTPVTTREEGGYLRFVLPLRDSGTLDFQLQGRKPVALGAGALQLDGGFALGYPGGRIDLAHATLRAIAGDEARLSIAVLDAQGRRLFVLDQTHAVLDRDAGMLALRDMNLRIAPALAARLGRPAWSMRTVGGVDVHTRLATLQTAAAAAQCSAPWSGQDGFATDVALLEGANDSVFAMRCRLPGAPATGNAHCPLASRDGEVVLAPDATLRNIGATAIPWNEKFNMDFNGQAGPAQLPPYGNDQHPFLIWNLYRLNADGSLRQIGVSGVKHAFFAANMGCGCDDYHVVFPTCMDVYSSFNNDSANHLGPRDEVVPASGLWARCGSVYDRNCNGKWDRVGGDDDDAAAALVDGAADAFDLRLVASEADLLPALNPGARYLFEYWYVVRDDAGIDNSIGYRELVPGKQAGLDGNGVWSFAVGPLQHGAALAAWLAPPGEGFVQQRARLDSAEGHADVAVRVEALGNGRWRYRYAVMNLDFMRARIDPAHADAPDIGVLSNAGFAVFRVPLPPGASVADIDFADADRDPGNDWQASVSDGMIEWHARRAPSSVAINPLDWGTLYSFGFSVDALPGPASASLGVATAVANLPDDYAVANLAPSRLERIFANGFDA